MKSTKLMVKASQKSKTAIWIMLLDGVGWFLRVREANHIRV